MTYKVVKWRRSIHTYEDRHREIYTDTDVYIFPFNCRDLDYYWEKKLEKMAAQEETP